MKSYNKLKSKIYLFKKKKKYTCSPRIIVNSYTDDSFTSSSENFCDNKTNCSSYCKCSEGT